MNQKKVWDSIAPDWNSLKTKVDPSVMKFLDSRGEGKIIDIGCGSGRNFPAINKSMSIYATDFSKEQINYAKQRADNLGLNPKIILCEVDNLPFDNDFFDYALMIAVLHCVEGEKKRRKALKELFRVLRSGGEALITVWESISEGLKGDGEITWEFEGVNYPRYTYFFTDEEIMSLVKSVGFKIISKERFTGKSGKWGQISLVVKKF